MKYSKSSQPFTHGKAQAPAPTGGRIGGAVNKVAPAGGVKNSAINRGTNGTPLKGTALGSMKKPK